MWTTWIWFLGWEDPLEEGVATRSSILDWRIPMDRGAWWAQSMWLQRVGHDWATKHNSTAQHSLSFILWTHMSSLSFFKAFLRLKLRSRILYNPRAAAGWERTRLTRSDSQEVCSRKQTGREKKGGKPEPQPFVLNRKSKMVSDLGTPSLWLTFEIEDWVFIFHRSSQSPWETASLFHCAL